MACITVRSIPDEIMERLRALAAVERRSLNGEILMLIEAGLERETTETPRRTKAVSSAVQTRLWEDLCGRWSDKRGWEEISADILSHRTIGRKVAL
jgi:plasmid stability protein